GGRGGAVGAGAREVADGDLAGTRRAPAGEPVVQVPGKNPFTERHALELLDVAQGPQRRVIRVHGLPKGGGVDPRLVPLYAMGRGERRASAPPVRGPAMRLAPQWRRPSVAARARCNWILLDWGGAHR